MISLMMMMITMEMMLSVLVSLINLHLLEIARAHIIVGKTPEEGGDFKLSGRAMFGVILICIAGVIALILLIITIIIKTGLHRNKKDK